ncbi:MAG: hypothetical protein GY853_03845 [PVC group bacterium]|nr:hypothetical protein [PVC group bacterium]
MIIDILKKNRQNGFLFLLVLLLFFHGASNLGYLLNNPLPEGKDSYAHITAFLNFSQIIFNGAENPFYISGKSLIYNLVFVSFDYPPFFYFIAFLINFFLGNIWLNAALFTSTLFFMLLLVSVYKIGSEFDRATGLLAVFICSVYPIVFSSSRHFSLELSLAGMVSAGVWILLKTDFFKRRNISCLLGVILGLGILTKQTFILYIAGPLAIVMGIAWTNSRREKEWVSINNMAICLLTAVAIGSVFYFNKNIYSSAIARAGFIGAVENNNIISLSHLTYYPRVWFQTMGIFFLSLFVFSLFLLRGIKKHLIYLLLFWFFVPMVFLSFFVLKYSEYTIAYLPAQALITAVGIRNIKNRYFNRVLISLIVIIGLYTYGNITYGNGKIFTSQYYPESVIASSSENSISEGDLFELLGSSYNRVGIFYDKKQPFAPAYILRGIFSQSNKKGQFVDILFSPSVFFNSIEEFDYLIYVSDSQNKWPEEKQLRRFVEDINKNRHSQIKIKHDLASDLMCKDKDLYLSEHLFKKLIGFNRRRLFKHRVKLYDKSNDCVEYVNIYQRER